MFAAGCLVDDEQVFGFVVGDATCRCAAQIDGTLLGTGEAVDVDWCTAVAHTEHHFALDGCDCRAYDGGIVRHTEVRNRVEVEQQFHALLVEARRNLFRHLFEHCIVARGNAVVSRNGEGDRLVVVERCGAWVRADGGVSTHFGSSECL